MNNHDLLAYSVASEAVAHIRSATSPWDTIFSPTIHATSSRSWPVPDFVLLDTGNGITVAGEFKPPDQSKREYLTGLGQALAYSYRFDYSLLVVPSISDDRFPIADYIASVLSQSEYADLPIALLAYNPSYISTTNGKFEILKFYSSSRVTKPTDAAVVENSLYAKWREASPQELLTYMVYIFEEICRPTSTCGTVRDRAFERTWDDLQAGKLLHWAGDVRTSDNTPKNKIAVNKNYRNFLNHIGWIEGEGLLTDSGFNAIRLGTKYGPFSVPFIDYLARCVLIEGKHLVLLQNINDFQNKCRASGQFFSEKERPWLDLIEDYLNSKGLLKQNPGRAGAAVANSPRGFFKAEKQLWKNLGLVELYGPKKGRIYHPKQGLVINWSRITSLIS